MSNSENIKAEIVEFIYDLLSEERMAELRLRISHDTEIAALYKQTLQTASLIADASCLETDFSVVDSLLIVNCENNENHKQSQTIPIPQNTDSGTTQIAHPSHFEIDLPQTPSRLIFSPHTVWEYTKRAVHHERGVNRVMSYAAITLVVITICGFLFQRYQMSRIARLPLRIVAIAPEILVKNSPQTLQIQLTDLIGEERQMPVSVTLSSNDQTFVKLTEQTDEHGKLSLPLSKLTEQLSGKTQDESLQLAISTEDSQSIYNKKLVATLKLTAKPPKIIPDYRAEVAAVNYKSEISNHASVDSLVASQLKAKTIPAMQQSTVTQQLPLPYNQMTSNSIGLYWPQNNAQNSQQFSNPALKNNQESLSIPLVSSVPPIPSPNYQCRDSRSFSFQTNPKPVASPPTAESKLFSNEPAPRGETGTDIRNRNQGIFDSGDIYKDDASLLGKNNSETSIRGGIPSSRREANSINGQLSGMSQSVPKVAFFAESGHLAAFLENRVFFHATIDGFPMAEFAGTIFDDQNRNVAEIKSNVGGFGEFYFVPEMNRHYRVVTKNDTIALDLPITEVPVTISVTEHFVHSGEPITVLLRSRQSGLPVVVSLSQSGVSLISESVETSDSVKSVTFSPPENITGLVTITVFEVKDASLSILATENILCSPQNFLTLNILPLNEKQNDKLTYPFDLHVIAPNGKSVADAQVTLRAIRITPNVLPKQFSEQVADFLFAEIPTETLLQFLGQFSQNDKSIPWNDIEQWLAVNEKISREKLNLFVASCLQTTNNTDSFVTKPIVIDNLISLRADYDRKIETIRQNQKISGRIIGIIVIFGGMSLAVFSMILAVMRLASGSRMFMVVIVSGVACVLICMVTMREQTDTVMRSEIPQFSTAKSEKSSGSFQSFENAKLSARSADASSFTETDRKDSAADLLKKENTATPKSQILFFALQTQQPQTFPSLELFYENFDLKSDVNGDLHFDVPITENSHTSFYLIIDAVSPDGLTGWKRWKQMMH
ncbi:MAG: hypothetical protein LBJ67_03575 [Planctomycetaceae bacterium]|jgi:hypothetical protein|nr:hypothetical protein [Planctomycetaceae bacterium]